MRRATWQQLAGGLPNGVVYSPNLYLHPARPATLFASQNCALYRSVAAGQTWGSLDGMPVGAISLAFDTANPNAIYAAAWSLGVYLSLDGGDTWIVALPIEVIQGQRQIVEVGSSVVLASYDMVHLTSRCFTGRIALPSRARLEKKFMRPTSSGSKSNDNRYCAASRLISFSSLNQARENSRLGVVCTTSELIGFSFNHPPFSPQQQKTPSYIEYTRPRCTPHKICTSRSAINSCNASHSAFARVIASASCGSTLRRRRAALTTLEVTE